VRGSISTKSTCAPQYIAQLADATKVIGLVQSQSPGPRSSERQAMCSAAVALLTATACWVSVWRYTNSIAGPYGTTSFDGYIAYQVSIPGKSSLSVIDKSISIYLNEGHVISATAELNSSLHFHASWEVIS
jgi:hypothetical protein